MNYFPKYFSRRSIYLYIGALVVCSLLFMSNSIPFIWLAFGLVEVVGFFYFSNLLTRKWADLPVEKFTKRLFYTSLIIRLIWVFASYYFYNYMTGQPFEFFTGDAKGYHGEASWLADMIHKGNIQPYFKYINGRYSDMGYPFYLGWLYAITGKSILFARILKAFYGAITCWLVYKLTTRNFGEGVGRMAAIFTMLMPNLILYTGMHLKEVEMLLLTVGFVERADHLIRTKKYNFINIAFPLLLAGLLFFFRTVLGATALFALFSAIAFSSTELLTIQKRIILTVWIIITVGYFIGGNISTELEKLWQDSKTNQQSSMQWRSERENGNKYAKYAQSAIFAPLIFVIPFPTVVNVNGQENQMLINGGNYVKNILVAFVLFALYWVIKNRKWRDYVLIGSFTLGYLIIISLSAFAQSERFHQPALPFELMMAAFGISLLTNKQKQYFNWYMVFVFAAIVVWSWYKLAGRGLV